MWERLSFRPTCPLCARDNAEARVQLLKAYANYLRLQTPIAVMCLADPAPSVPNSTAAAWVAGQPDSLRIRWPQFNE